MDILADDQDVASLDIFSSVLLLEEKLDAILHSFLDFDNIRNYSRIWSQVIVNTIIPSLSSWVKYSNLLYSRYFDEFEKEKDEIDPTHIIYDVLSNTINNKVEIALLLKTYIEYAISKDPETTQSQPLVSALLDAEIALKEIIFLFYNSNNLRDYLDSVIDKITAYSDLITDERLIHIVSELQPITRFEHLSSLQLDIVQTLLTSHAKIIKQLSDTWWFSDHLLDYHLVDSGIKIFDEIVKQKDEILDQEILNRIDKLSVVEYPIAKVSENFALAKFEINKAMNLLSQGNFKLASEIFRIVLKYLEKIFLTIGAYPGSEELRKYNIKAEVEYSYVNLYLSLSQMNSRYKVIVQAIHDDDLVTLRKNLDDLKKLIQAFDLTIDVPYISAVMPIFENITSTIDLLLSMNESKDEILETIQKTTERMENRVENATEQVQQDFQQLSDDEVENMQQQISKLKKDTEILQLTLYFLPSTSRRKTQIVNRLLAMEALACSIEYEIKSTKLVENKFIELIYKAKSHFHAKFAFSYISKLGSKLPSTRIKAHYSGTLISGYIKQIELSKHILQFLCLNTILPQFYMVLSHDGSIISNKEQERKTWEKRLFGNKEFLNLLGSINQSTNLLLKHKTQQDTAIRGVDWTQIEFTQQVSSGLQILFQSIVHSVLAIVSQNLELKDDVILYATNAKDFAFKASEQLQILSLVSSEIKETSNSVFNFAKYCQQVIASPLQINLRQLPITELFKLFRNIVFAL